MSSGGCVQAGYLLAGVLEAHPGMKLVAAREVERFLFRPGLAERARYYAVVFLNQLPLSHAPAHGAAPISRFCAGGHAIVGGLTLIRVLGVAGSAARC